MRRIAALAALIMLLASIVCPVLAATGATSVTGYATVSNDGSCQVTLNATIHLDSVVEDLTFPVPREARNITLNGGSARTKRSGDVLLVDLSRIIGSVAGDFTVTVSYSLAGAVTVNDQGKPELNLQLLSGFSYPVDRLEFTVSLPGVFDTKPSFSSGYYQQSIESNLTYTIQNNTITGVVDKQLKDLETFTMTLEVSEEMFPDVIKQQWRSNFDNIAMWVFTAAAVIYWFVFLPGAPIFPNRSTTAPEGFTAGQLGSILTGQGADLTLMVFTWARLGYILIHLEDHGRVVLHKRMDMGNERSGFEQKLFRQLFGKRRMVDGSSYHYAQLCRKAFASSGNVRSLYRKRSGSRKVFSVLCMLIGLFSGISLGNAMTDNAILGGLLAFIFAVLCAVASLVIQQWVRGLLLRQTDSLYYALGCAAIWLLIAALAGDFPIALAVVIGQFAAGLFGAYGGRRNSSGRQLASQVLGLRRHLRTVPKEQLHKLTNLDPDYFFSFAPTAMALNCCETFAKRFGKRRLGGCPYLTTGMDGHMTALEWCQVLQRAATSLDARYKRLFLETILSK